MELEARGGPRWIAEWPSGFASWREPVLLAGLAAMIPVAVAVAYWIPGESLLTVALLVPFFVVFCAALVVSGLLDDGLAWVGPPVNVHIAMHAQAGVGARILSSRLYRSCIGLWNLAAMGLLATFAFAGLTGNSSPLDKFGSARPVFGVAFLVCALALAVLLVLNIAARSSVIHLGVHGIVRRWPPHRFGGTVAREHFVPWTDIVSAAPMDAGSARLLGLNLTDDAAAGSSHLDKPSVVRLPVDGRIVEPNTILAAVRYLIQHSEEQQRLGDPDFTIQLLTPPPLRTRIRLSRRAIKAGVRRTNPTSTTIDGA